MKDITKAIAVLMACCAFRSYAGISFGTEVLQGHLTGWAGVWGILGKHAYRWTDEGPFDEYVEIGGAKNPSVNLDVDPSDAQYNWFMKALYGNEMVPGEGQKLWIPVVSDKVLKKSDITPVAVGGTLPHSLVDLKVMTDAELYSVLKSGDTSQYWFEVFFPENGQNAKRLWIQVGVRQGAISSVPVEVDVSKRPAAGKWSNMTMTEYAAQYEADFRGTLQVYPCPWFCVGIKETGEVFSTPIYEEALDRAWIKDSYAATKALVDAWVEVMETIDDCEQDASEAILCVTPWSISAREAGAVELVVWPKGIQGGTVSGNGVYRPGDVVAIEATPSEGYSFGGWFSDEACTTPLTRNQDYLNSSCQYTVGNEDKMIYAKFVEQQADTLKMDLLHNYAFSEGEGVWYGDEVWKVAMLEDDGLYTNEGDVPWVFEHGAKFYQNGNICIAVTGCGSEKIVPVITLGTASAADNLSATVLTDAEFAAKLHIAEYDFEQDDDEFVYEDYAARIGCYYPASVWTNGSVVEGRQWILVSLKDVNIGPDGFFSPKTFAVGIEGTDQKTPVITLCPTDKLPNETTFTPSNVFGLDIMMNGYPNANSEHCSFDPFFELWYGDGDGRVPYVFDVGDPYEDGGDSVRNLTVSVPSGGELYLKMETEYRGGHNTWNGELDCLQISGSAYGGNVRTVGSAWSGPYGSYWVVLTAKSAGDLVIELGDFEKFIVNGIWFRPSSVNEAQCLATEAWYRGSTTVANGRSMSKYLGFVTGSGVIAFGEKATLVCYPNEGEELDHWKFINCTAPADATINNRVLTFTVSEPLYDEIADTEEPLKRIVVRPVFRPAGQGGDQSTFIVVFNANGGECSETSREVEKGGALGALPAPVRDGYQFNGWYTAPAGGTKITSATKITKDTVFYAHWSAKIELVLADGCDGMGTVSGGGVIAAGKKATLKATANNGYVFAGWYDGAGNPLSGGVDYRTATYPYVSTGEPAAITARFVPAEADAAEENIVFAISGTAGVYAAGEAIEQQVTVSSFSIPTVTVTGLPAGLKFDAKALKITGKPTKPGELATATFTIKNQSNKTGKKETVTYRIGDATSGLLDDLKYNTVPGEDGYALIVPGVETDMHGLLGLDPGDLAGWMITGLPAGLKFDSRTGTFSGKATQSGKTYLVTFKKGAEIATITLGTKPDPKLTLTKYLLVRDDIAPEVEDGTYYSNFKLTGGGNYQVGKKVSVSATAPKNWMFVGWASPSDFNSKDNTVRLTMVSTDAKYTFIMPSPGEEADEVELTAVFTHVFGSAIVPDDEIEE